ncbi:hypothetical protein HK405_004467 [Cladochytrium tenue]|nr:hypothetical protein HK405_004467 [Cladochytrium tenue]
MVQRSPAFVVRPVVAAVVSRVRARVVRPNLAAALELAEARLAAAAFFADSRFSAADAICLFCVEAAIARVPDLVRPKTRDWRDRIMARPSWKSVVDVDAPLNII